VVLPSAVYQSSIVAETVLTAQLRHTAPPEDGPARSLRSLRGLRLPCSRSRCSRAAASRLPSLVGSAFINAEPTPARITDSLAARDAVPRATELRPATPPPHSFIN